VQFHQTLREGAYRVELDKREDDRGFFARVVCEKEFREMGLETRSVQANNSLTSKKCNLARLLHCQLNPQLK
jgi:dTDP-4-dehydrorhamnose 3,5-epimerase